MSTHDPENEKYRPINDDEKVRFITEIERLSPYLEIELVPAFDELDEMGDYVEPNGGAEDANALITKDASFLMEGTKYKLTKTEVVGMSEPEALFRRWSVITVLPAAEVDDVKLFVERGYGVYGVQNAFESLYYESLGAQGPHDEHPRVYTPEHAEETSEDDEFTKQRFDRLMPLLRQLGPDYLIDRD